MRISSVFGSVLALGLAIPGLSQTTDHSAHKSKTAEPKTSPKSETAEICTPEHAAMGHCKLDEGNQASSVEPTKSKSTSSDPSCPPEHAAMGHCTPKKPGSPSKSDDTATGTDLPAGNARAPEAPEVNYADKTWGREAMAPARALMYNEHGGMFSSKFLLDLAAAKYRNGEDGYQWDGEAWLGEDINRIVIKTEGESYSDGALESGEVQAVYSRAIGPYFNFQAGIRHDFRPEPSKNYAAFGFEGLAPYWNEIEGTLFISDDGDLLGRFKGRYDQLITQRLVLETVAEINLSAQTMQEQEIGTGLVDGEFSLRLRYEIEHEIAPYLGLSWKSTFGETARFARASGEGKDHSSLLVGLRLWM